MLQYERCGCGCDDCEICHPEYSGTVSCRRCGDELKVWQVTEDGLCENCMEHKECEVCGEWTDVLNEDWQKEGVICPECLKKSLSEPIKNN